MERSDHNNDDISPLRLADWSDAAPSTITVDYPWPRDSDAAASATTRQLSRRYWEILRHQRLSWTEHHRLVRLLGAGGHGLVYLSEGKGSDGFTLPVALKIFSPERCPSEKAYSEAMRLAARIAARVARIQQDNLLDVRAWMDRGWVRVMEMEWIDGFDLRRLLTPTMLEKLRHQVAAERWEAINDVVVTEGLAQPRLKPGVAIAIVRDCLAALDALHRQGIIHGDVKPANIMLKRTGDVKLVDIGSAFELADPPSKRTCTPAYAAPEVLEGGEWTPRSDLASVGYVLVELLAGVQPFAGVNNYHDLMEAKRRLPARLPEILPPDVVCNELLMGLCEGLVAVDPACRFVSAEQADVAQDGAVGIQRQLIKSDLASEYDREIRDWLQNLGE